MSSHKINSCEVALLWYNTSTISAIILAIAVKGYEWSHSNSYFNVLCHVEELFSLLAANGTNTSDHACLTHCKVDCACVIKMDPRMFTESDMWPVWGDLLWRNRFEAIYLCSQESVTLNCSCSQIRQLTTSEYYETKIEVSCVAQQSTKMQLPLIVCLASLLGIVYAHPLLHLLAESEVSA